jgi:hypothetical protein
MSTGTLTESPDLSELLRSIEVELSEEEILADLLYPEVPEEIARVAEEARLESHR